VFGNKGLRWKLAAALAAIALLGVYSERRGELRNPSVWRCLAQPERFKDRTLWVPAATVLSTGPAEHMIRTVGNARIRVNGPAPAAPGTSVAYVAVFRVDGPHLEPLETRTLPASDWRRTVMEVVSVLVALLVLANFARHFLFRPKVLQVEGGAP
jgi:hypothetical protein